ncbi:Uu.00g055520.m01.CDS01 [Anthostomella pinea]|uniref:Uu.00g055520.m01.CDS01 n=1 Tax=Anthostomella pinea TaxID=933095 RepID=A0AAI8VWU4_9PEZI|nr:Uu.00g055520.m01.CDS01 [Anthostomella pinea]
MEAAYQDGDQKLSDDVLAYLGEFLLDRPSHVYALARVNKRVWGALKRQLFVADVHFTKEREKTVEADINEGDDAATVKRSEYDARLPLPDPPTALHWSIANGETTSAELAIDAASTIWLGYLDVKDMWDQSPIYLVAETGMLQILEKLIAGGACIEAVTTRADGTHPAHVTPLTKAGASAVMPLKCRFIVSERHPKPAEYEGWDVASPLCIAALRGSFAMVKLLLDAGENPTEDYDPIFHCTPLHLAAQVNSVHIIELLVSHGAVVDQYDWSDLTAVYRATEHSNLGSADRLLDYGANGTNCSEDGISALDHTVQSDKMLSITEKMHAQCEDASSEEISNAFRKACYSPIKSMRTIIFLLDHGVHLPSSTLHDLVSFEYYHPEVLKRVLATGRANLDARDIDGLTAFEFALIHRRSDAVNMLLEAGARTQDLPVIIQYGLMMWHNVPW